jgi:hypothetical protein
MHAGGSRPPASRWSSFQTPTRNLAISAGTGEIDLDHPADFADLEGRLGRGGRAAYHRPVGDAVHAAVPDAVKGIAYPAGPDQPGRAVFHDGQHGTLAR